MRKTLLFIIFFQVICTCLHAQTWNGSASTDWNTAANWSPNTVPTSSSNVVIPGALARYPVLANDVTINNINMQSGSQLDVNGFQFTVTNATTTYTYFTGATLNNSNAGTSIVLNINTGAGGYVTYFRNCTVNGNIIFNLTGTDGFNEADAGGSGNTYNGNATFNINDVVPFYLSYVSASNYTANLIIKRTAAGTTSLFNAGATITGNFSYTNNTTGQSTLGATAYKTAIGGTVNIAANYTTNDVFHVYRLINQTTGGTVNIQKTTAFDIQQDTLKLTSFSVTGYSGSAYAYFFNNSITGDVTIADSVNNTSGYATYLHNNVITGNSSFTSNGTNILYEADAANSANTFNGNTSFTANNSATLSVSNGSASNFNGNLTVTRTAGGTTQFFGAGAIITGNFSYTNNTTGQSTLGATAYKTAIGGTVNIAANYTTNDVFHVYRLINQTTGGTVNIQKTTAFDIQQDTLKLTSFSVTGYSGSAYAYFFNNSITGDVTIADSVNNTSGYATYLHNNVITGNSSFTSNGTNILYEADAANSANTFNGNTSFTANNSATLSVSNGSASNFNGNLTVTRTAGGTTQFFGAGAIITGNFSYTNNTTGQSTLGATAYKTAIGGTVNIAANYTTNDVFHVYRLINQTTGGTVNIQKTTAFDIQQDTLKLTSFSVTGYRGSAYAYFISNSIAGDVTIADDASYTSGYATYLRNNVINGNSSFTNNGTNTLYDADAANTANKYVGNVTYIKNGGPINVATGSTDEITKNLTLNSASGITLGTLKFNGTTDGVIDQLGTQPISMNGLIMEKTGTGKLTLNKQVTITTSATFNAGIMSTSSGKELIFANGATTSNASDASYVDGPVTKTGNQAFTFPVGQINELAPISISAPASTTDAFLAQYFAHSPQADGYDSTQKDPTLNHISKREYWLLNRTAGTSNVTVTLSWATDRSGIVNSMPDLRVARWNGTMWKDEGNGGTSGTNDSGYVQSGAAVTNFSPFTLASVNSNNPLPVNLIEFRGTKSGSATKLSWSTANEVDFDHFELQRSVDTRTYTSFQTIAARGGSSDNSYNATDNAPDKGVNYYRLKMVDRDGHFKYSQVIVIDFSGKAFVSVYPNPANSSSIHIYSDQTLVNVQLLDISGKTIKQFLPAADNIYNVSDLKTGMYFIKLSGKSEIQTIKFSKL